MNKLYPICLIFNIFFCYLIFFNFCNIFWCMEIFQSNFEEEKNKCEFGLFAMADWERNILMLIRKDRIVSVQWKWSTIIIRYVHLWNIDLLNVMLLWMMIKLIFFLNKCVCSCYFYDIQNVRQFNWPITI